jgi:hypothetical protein
LKKLFHTFPFTKLYPHSRYLDTFIFDDLKNYFEQQKKNLKEEINDNNKINEKNEIILDSKNIVNNVNNETNNYNYILFKKI